MANIDHLVTQFIPVAAWNFISDKFSDFGKDTLAKVCDFVANECIPAEAVFHAQISTDPTKRWTSYPAVIEELKDKAKKLGLWNLFLCKAHYPDVGVPLTNLEYAVIAEVAGHSIKVAPEAMNCSAPDTGNMEVLARYGTPAQKDRWLKPLLDGKIRSSFAMTEPAVASSDATNIQTRIEYDKKNKQIVINGHKWWISGAGDPRNGVHLVIGKSDLGASKHVQQSIVIVPADTTGVKLVRPMKVFGYDDAPEGHFEVIYDNVRIPEENIVHGWGKGFEVIQGRLGPGRIHHCMRSIGLAERALTLMLVRVTDPRKKAFGKELYKHGSVMDAIAFSRMELDAARMLVYSAAHQIDRVRSKGAMKSIGLAKALVPEAVNRIVDRAMQVHGGEGVSQDVPLAAMFSGIRTLRFADGPDEVHRLQIAIQELKRAPGLHTQREKDKEAEVGLMRQYGVEHDVWSRDGSKL